MPAQAILNRELTLTAEGSSAVRMPKPIGALDQTSAGQMFIDPSLAGGTLRITRPGAGETISMAAMRTLIESASLVTNTAPRVQGRLTKSVRHATLPIIWCVGPIGATPSARRSTTQIAQKYARHATSTAMSARVRSIQSV